MDQSIDSPVAEPPRRRPVRKQPLAQPTTRKKTTRKTKPPPETPDQQRTTRVLRSTCKKTSKKFTTNRPNRVSARTNQVQSDSSLQDSHSSMNFSEFEKYSLIVDKDSPDVIAPSVQQTVDKSDSHVAIAPATPQIESSIKPDVPPPSAFTSTPHHRLRQASDTSLPYSLHDVAANMSKLEDDSMMKQCRVELERLSMSDVSSIADSPAIVYTPPPSKIGKSPFVGQGRSLKRANHEGSYVRSPLTRTTPNTSHQGGSMMTPCRWTANHSQHITARRRTTKYAVADTLPDSTKGNIPTYLLLHTYFWFS